MTSGACEEGAFRLLKAVGVPIRLHDGFGDGAPFLVVEQRHSIRKTQQIRRLVGPRLKFRRRVLSLPGRLVDMSAFIQLQMRARCLSVSEADLDLKRVAAVDGGRPRRHRVKARIELLVQPFCEPLFADGRNAIGAGSRDRHRLDRPVERLRLEMRDPLRIRAFRQA